ncbi:hypothetical protein BVY03_01535 [bacterium K02(2017)]|nr:hypothetical protein BVY03_01535 [bacterium K02(2017)]
MLKDFFDGFQHNFLGFNYFLKNKNLWKFAFIPLLINISLLFLLVSLYVGYFDVVFTSISKPIIGWDIKDPSNFLWTILDSALWLVRGVIKIIFFILCLMIIFVLVYFISSIINSPFYEVLAEKVLIKHGLLSEEPFKFNLFLKSVLHSLKIEFSKIFLFVFVSLGLFVMSWVPIVGPLFSLLGILFTSWTFAMGLSTYPMVLKRASFNDVLGWSSQNKFRLIGFGLPAIIPFFGLLIMNFQVVGGTLIYIKATSNKRS